METRRLWASLVLTALTLVILCAVLTASTYAWFTFDPYTNVTPMEGKISDGDTNLLISESKDGPFEVKCGLHPTAMAELLQPVSTLDLTKFYASSAQNRDGISIASAAAYRRCALVSLNRILAETCPFRVHS